MRFYLPVFTHYNPKDGLDWTQESVLALLTRDNVVEAILAGEWHDLPSRVLEIDDEAGVCRNVTAELAADVGDRTYQGRPYPEEPRAELKSWLDRFGSDYFERGNWAAESVLYLFEC